MPPFNAPRTYPPSWIDQLRSAVLSPDVHWTPAEEVSIVAATRALQGWLADRRPYDGQHKQGWKSAIADFQYGVGRQGQAFEPSSPRTSRRRFRRLVNSTAVSLTMRTARKLCFKPVAIEISSFSTN